MNNVFRSATLKLTLWYVLLVMAISALFSGVVYHVATDEVRRGLSNQTARIYREYPVFNNDSVVLRGDDLLTSSQHILRNLIYLNIVVLAGASLTSYWLARRTLRPIEESNERQKRFVADASHELRTPVTTLKMETEVALIDKHAANKDLRAALTSNLEEANKLESLLNHLLRLSRLESNELIGSFITVAVKDIVQAAVNHTRSLADTKQVAVRIKSSSIYVHGDHDSLVQLVVILLDNAIKYSPESSVVTVTANGDTAQASITVEDHGAGIEPKALEHVFDRFYRADASRASSGFGLGLAIAKQIADLHHGTITITSKAGKGTKATVSLPLATGQVDEHAPSGTSRP